MKLLFDTAALMNLIEQKGKEVINVINRQYTIDLAYYELGNANWKNVHRKLISLELGKKIGQNIAIILQAMKILSYNLDDQDNILEFAGQTDVTFYDASYLYTALKHDMILVTDDDKMLKIAKIKKISSKLSKDLI